MSSSSGARDGPGPAPQRVGLPEAVRVCLFDLDGVLTRTATVHARAWRELFDELGRARRAAGEPGVAPMSDEDYRELVDGRPRLDGVRAFLAARGVELPEGTDRDAAGTGTVRALARRKQDLFRESVDRDGVAAYPGALRYVRAARAAGLGTVVVTASANARPVLAAAGYAGLVDHLVDGTVDGRDRLAGKPAPDTFLAGARAAGVAPGAAAVFEDAVAGVEAGRAVRFARVVGVDRTGHGDRLRAAGADVVVGDPEELLPGDPLPGRRS